MAEIHHGELRTILKNAETDEELRARIEELADFGSIDDDQRQFLKLVTELNNNLAKAAGVEPEAIDPNVDGYHSTRGSALGYTIGEWKVFIVAFRDYQKVSRIEVKKDLYFPTIAEFFVYPVGPEKVTELVVNCINTLNKK